MNIWYESQTASTYQTVPSQAIFALGWLENIYAKVLELLDRLFLQALHSN
jgi:hypothetical protein